MPYQYNATTEAILRLFDVVESIFSLLLSTKGLFGPESDAVKQHTYRHL